MEMQREQRAMQAEDEDAMEAEAAAQPTAQQHQDGIGAWVDFRSAEDAERAVASAAAVGPGVAEPAKMIKAVEVLKALLARGVIPHAPTAVLEALDDETARKLQRLKRRKRLEAWGGVMRLPDELLGAVGVFADARPVVRARTTGGLVYVTNYCRGLVCASRRTHAATERAWEVIARKRYPKWVLDRHKDLRGSEEGYASWPALIDHDAAKFGMWCLDVIGVSRRDSPETWSEGRIQRVAVDGLADGELVAVVESYGKNLDEALGSALHAGGARIPHILGNNKLKCIVRSRGHQIFRLTFASQASALRATKVELAYEARRQHQSHHHVRDENGHWQLVDGAPGPAPGTPPNPLPECYRTGWDTCGDSLAFQYGDPLRQHYGIGQFLRKDPGQTWDAAFRGPGPLPEGASRRRFVPRPLRFPKEERTPRADWVGD